MRSRSARATGAHSLATLAVAFIVGCGGEQGGGSGSPAPGDVAGARAELEKFEGIPRFEPPGPAFDAAGQLRGKTVFEIPITSEVPFITAVEEGMQQAADAVGARLVVYPNQGEPSQWAQGIRAAIAQQADVITLFAQNPALLGPQIRQAEEAGIPVVVVRTSGEEEPCQADPDGEVYGTACVPGPFEQAGRLEADWVIADSGGQANVLVLTASDARSTVPLLAGLEAEFAERCPGCRVRYVDVPIPEWANRVQSEVQSALVADPTIDYLIPIYDSMSRYAVPGLLATGAADRVKIATFNGTPFVLEMLQDADIVAMDVGENLAWLGWATMDQAFRLAAGVEPARSQHTALRVFTDANVAETGRPPGLDRGYGDDYVAGYRRLWGLGG
jgi:ribose transport system substrate-binding protein